nr:ribonuclease H-like domain-containing protein [Tanacetum cinerariifolium]
MSLCSVHLNILDWSPSRSDILFRDLVQGNVTINRVYYIKGLNHNLFSVGQFCDADLEVAFKKSTCFVRDLQGNDLLTDNQGFDLYTISLQESTSSTPLCLMAKATPTQAWLWHQRLSHLNFDYINLLSKKDIVIGLPKLKYIKDQLCSSCELNYDNPDPVPQRQDVSSSADADVPSQQELDLLFGPLYDEFFNADNPLEQVRGNPSRPVQTRRQLTTDPEMCKYALTVSTAEPNNIKEAMADLAWIEAMQEELHQFDRLQVWELVDKPFGKTVIKLKWLWKNKKDEDQTVIRNKATQVFSILPDGHVMVFLNGPLKEEVYVAQPDGFVDPDHPEKVYRLRKALYRLKQASRAWYDELSKFLTSKGFTKDLSGNPVDQTDYRSKIGSLMYLTSSRLDIVQAICFCARYQSRPTEKHLKEVKRIFRYLRGTVNMRLWYPKGSSFELTAFSDADHAGCIDSRKSISGGIQFLGDKLVRWMSKKQNCTAMSSAEAEYVALSASCAQVMWMRTQIQDYGFNYNKIPFYCDSQSAIAISCNPVQHSRTKHIHTRYHFIKKQVENGIVELYFVRTEYQLADMFTKALPEDRFKYLVRRIGMRCLTPAELEVLAKEFA